ncbi:peptidylprolyl isomerase [Natronoflexus pectinivorans]|uniref:Peptidyl-prolyl cis-trans isomerase SurA n=1 Tax=Natronoflexus pectinivorans TaxID=682526 RepID=A0A4R2GG40_9BACT|nr:peptidylprolyl isomerase [Natronoflexus pectinivorans]TCO07223.1 peptidyl-prolyl cis-trans isomerase SurA [Natronoflexus pectinivorans]
MKRIACLFSGLFFMLVVSLSQSNETILQIGEHEFTKGEFWHVYNKNKHLPNFTETPLEFAERFIDYKLKVVEAIHQGLDTTASFKREFNQYAEDLKASFLIDSAALENKSRQAFLHMQGIVNASHILIRVEEMATPSDTVKAWNKINDLRTRVHAGESFGDLATRYSEDPSAVNNQGKLGYFSAFRMVYPFEKAAFATPVGEVSNIIRTNFGYHIIKVHEKIPNPGRIRVAHIMKMFPRNASDEVKAGFKTEIDSIYQVLRGGESFAQLAAKHSDDQNSANNGGEMRPFTLQEMVPEFAFASFALENDGDISEPVLTDFGWHIIKRLEITSIGDYASNRNNIMNMMRRDGRNRTGEISFVQQKRKESNFYLNQDLVDLMKSKASGETDNSSFFSSLSNNDGLLYSYFDKKMSLKEFVLSLKNHQTFNIQTGFNSVEKILDELIHETIIAVERRDMAKNNPEFRYLVNEYHDGLLIFEISNNEVWQNVGSDTLALQNHYRNNIDEFSTPYQLDGVICEVKTRRLVRRVNREINRQGSDFLVQILKDNSRSPDCYWCETGLFEFVSDASNPLNSVKLPDGNRFSKINGDLYWAGVILEPQPIPYREILGHVMSSYQRYKEKQWVIGLREKHVPEFNFNLLKN